MLALNATGLISKRKPLQLRHDLSKCGDARVWLSIVLMLWGSHSKHIGRAAMRSTPAMPRSTTCMIPHWD